MLPHAKRRATRIAGVLESTGVVLGGAGYEEPVRELLPDGPADEILNRPNGSSHDGG